MNHDDLLARLAWLYYIENLTQQEIGDRLNMPRVKVARLLKKARDEGIFEFRIVKRTWNSKRNCASASLSKMPSLCPLPCKVIICGLVSERLQPDICSPSSGLAWSWAWAWAAHWRRFLALWSPTLMVSASSWKWSAAPAEPI